MTKVYTAQNPVDAHLVKGLLEDQDISATVVGEFLFGARGEVPLTTDTCPTVWVLDDADSERAVQLIATFGEAQKASSTVGVWRCSCGEENEEQFLECWNCGKPRP